MRSTSGLAVIGPLLRALAIGACLHATCANAQAWLPESGTTTFSLGLNDVLNKKHYLPDGSEFDAGHTRVKSTSLSFAWSPSDRWMITGGLPYVRSRYYGERPHPTEIDDGHEHSTFTDLRVEAHYQLLDGPVAFAPFAAFVVPVKDYETLGHAAPGRGLKEYWLGFYTGALLDDWLPSTYVQLHYDYAIVEKVVGISHDRSRADLEFGHFLTPAWALSVNAAWQQTHGGIDVPIPPSNPLFPYHDRLASERYLNVGGGVSWFATPRFSVHAGYATAVNGRNGHKLDHGVNVSVSFTP